MDKKEVENYIAELRERLKWSADIEGEDYKYKCLGNEDVEIIFNIAESYIKS